MPRDAFRNKARAIQGMLQSADKPGHGLVSTLIGTALLIIGATTVFAELQDALDRIWRQLLKPAPDTRAELSR